MRRILLLLFLFATVVARTQCSTWYVFHYPTENRYDYLNKEKQELSGPVKSVVERTSRIHLVSCDSTYNEMVGLIVEQYQDSGKLVRVSETTLRYSEAGDFLSQSTRGSGFHPYQSTLSYKNGKVIRAEDFAYKEVYTYDSLNRISAHTIAEKHQNSHWKHPGWHYTYGYNDSGQLTSVKEKSKVVCTYSYDSLDRLHTVRDVSYLPYAYTVTFQYDEQGRKITETLMRDDSLSNAERLSLFYSGQTLLKKVYCEYNPNTLETYCMHTCHYTDGKLTTCDWNSHGTHQTFTYILDEHSNWIEKRWIGYDYEYIVTRKIKYYE